MKKFVLAVLMFLPILSHSGVWDETTPAGSDPISQGDDRLREMKEALGEALDSDFSVFPGTNPATAPLFIWTYDYGLAADRTSTLLQDGQIYHSTDSGVSEMYNGSGWKNVAISSYTTSSLNLNTGGFSLSGNITSDGNITTTGDDVDISTHLVVAGDLTVSGSFNPSVTHIIAYKNAVQSLTDNTYTTLTFVEDADSLSEFNGSTFTATVSGIYHVCVEAYFTASGGDTLRGALLAFSLNGSVAGSSRRSFLGTDTGPANGYIIGNDTVCSTFNLSASDTLSFLGLVDTSAGADGTFEGGGISGLGTKLSILRIL